MSQSNPKVFISYAWGGDFRKKEWLKERVLWSLYNMEVFWDRESVLHGQTADLLIEKALSERPLIVICMVDADYVRASAKSDSGLYRELQLIKRVRDQESVRVVPLILEPGLKNELHEALHGLTYLDVSAIASLHSSMGLVVDALVRGYTQRQVLNFVEHIAAGWELRQRLMSNLSWFDGCYYGCPDTREVRLNHGQLLVVPDWMKESQEWRNAAREEQQDFNPSLGIWHWDHFSCSVGMRALGVALMDRMFPKAAVQGMAAELKVLGVQLAQNQISMTKRYETLLISASDIADAAMHSDVTRMAAARLMALVTD